MKEQRNLSFAGLHEFVQRPTSTALVGERQHCPERIGCGVAIPVLLAVVKAVVHSHGSKFIRAHASELKFGACYAETE